MKNRQLWVVALLWGMVGSAFGAPRHWIQISIEGTGIKDIEKTRNPGQGSAKLCLMNKENIFADKQVLASYQLAFSVGAKGGSITVENKYLSGNLWVSDSKLRVSRPDDDDGDRLRIAYEQVANGARSLKKVRAGFDDEDTGSAVQSTPQIKIDIFAKDAALHCDNDRPEAERFLTIEDKDVDIDAIQWGTCRYNIGGIIKYGKCVVKP